MPLRWGFALLLFGATGLGALAAVNGRPEAPLLSEEEYPLQLEEIIVRGQAPRWREREAAAPRWEKEKFKLPAAPAPSRIDLLPRYSADERDDYDEVRDRMGAKARIKLFEMKF
jgi:hypothetical protein